MQAIRFRGCSLSGSWSGSWSGYWSAYLDTKVVHFAYFYTLWVTIPFAIEARVPLATPYVRQASGVSWQP